MKVCGARCGNSFPGMQTQARQTRTFADIPNAVKGSNPPPSANYFRLILLGESDFFYVPMCGDCVGNLKTTKPTEKQP